MIKWLRLKLAYILYSIAFKLDITPFVKDDKKSGEYYGE